MVEPNLNPSPSSTPTLIMATNKGDVSCVSGMDETDEWMDGRIVDVSVAVARSGWFRFFNNTKFKCNCGPAMRLWNVAARHIV